MLYTARKWSNFPGTQKQLKESIKLLDDYKHGTLPPGVSSHQVSSDADVTAMMQPPRFSQWVTIEIKHPSSTFVQLWEAQKIKQVSER